MEKWGFLTCSSGLIQPAFLQLPEPSAQRWHRPSELGLPTPITNQENALQACPEAHVCGCVGVGYGYVGRGEWVGGCGGRVCGCG